MARKPTYEELEQRIAELEAELGSRGEKGSKASCSYCPGAANRGACLLSSIVEKTQNIIYVKDVDGRFLLVNKSFCDIFDLRKDDVIGKTPLDLFPHDIADQHLENDLQVLQSRTSLTFNEQAVLADGCHEYISVKFPIAREVHDNQNRL